jgi:hypothetical protein
MTRKSGDRTTRDETSRFDGRRGRALTEVHAMNHRWFALALVSSATMASAWVVGCGDDEVFRDTDAGAFEGGTVPVGDSAPEVDAGDAAVPSTCGNSTGAPQRLLLTINNFAPPASEVVAFNIADKKVDGRFAFAGSLGQTSSLGSDPFVVEQASDVVARMNAQRPWEPVATWSVAGDDAVDGGPNAQPVAVVVPTCTKGYVLRFNRNKIAVIDTTQVADAGADAGATEGYVDLSSLVQADDKDGLVDMTAAYYVASKKRIYVLLGNYDRTTVGPPDYTLLCKNTTASIIAIDATTGQLVNLGGTAPGGGIALPGYNPVVGTPMAYDAARDRLLVYQGGCSTLPVGGGFATVSKREVDEVDLATGKTKTLVTLNDKGFPGSFVYMDGNRAALTFFFPNQTFFWNPTQPVLSAEIPGSLDYVTHDGKGNVIGGRRTTVDGGAIIEVLSVPFTGGDGGTVDASAVQKLGENPFTSNGGYLGGAEMWPRP